MGENILVTGASGFLAKRVVRHLQRSTDHYIITTSRQQESFPNHLVRDLKDANAELVENIDTIIHLAWDKKDHRQSRKNTERLVQLALESGVKRMIFISTTDVYGGCTQRGEVITENSLIQPKSEFAQEKYLAESALVKLTLDSSLNVITIRMSMVYHIDINNGFKEYINMVKSQRTLPLGCIHNERTMLALCNFESALSALLCSDVENEVLILADSFSLSTTELLEGLSVALDIPTKLYCFPELIVKTGLLLMNRKKFLAQMYADYKISSRYAQQKLDWKPSDNYNANLSR